MKAYSNILIFALGCLPMLVGGCAKEQEQQQLYGTLALSGGVEVSTEVQKSGGVQAKAVDASLRVQILYNNAIYREHDYAPGALSEYRISLPAGTYKLRAFTPNYYYPEPQGAQKGEPAYFNEQVFEVVPNRTTNLALSVKQGNIGVKLNVPQDVLDAFSPITVTVRTTGRTVVISGQDNALCYFHTPANAIVYYTVRATNQDGESFFTEERTCMVEAGNCYQLDIVL